MLRKQSRWESVLFWTVWTVLDLQDKSSWEERMVFTTHGVWTPSTQRPGVDVVFCQIRAAAFVFHVGLV